MRLRSLLFRGSLVHPVAGVTARWSHACAWLTDGTAYCWGENDRGQLGIGTGSSR